MLRAYISISIHKRGYADVLLNACKDIGLTANIGKTKYMEIGRHRGMIANEHIKIKPDKKSENL